MPSSFPIYSSVLLAPTATPTSPVTITTQFPVLSNLTNLSSSTGNIYFNFVITTGAVSTGPSAFINLRYIFSSDPTYSLSSLPLITLNNASTISVQVPSTLSIVRDFTSSTVIPIEGPYLYTWIDISNFQNPIGLTVNAYSANELTGGSTGTGVTSVGLSVPSIFSIANSPITSNGTMVVSLNAENANTVLAGPTSGGSGNPTFRNLVAADFGFNLTGNDIVACLGASLTLGTGSTGSNFVNSWPAQLSQNFSNTYVYNYGVSGSVAGPVGTANSGLAILAAASPSAYQYRNGSYAATTTSTLASLQATASGNGGNLYVFVDYGINDIGAYSLANFVTYIQSITSTLHGYGSNVKVIYNTPTATATIAPQAIATFANALKGNVNQSTQTYSASKADYLNDIGSVFTDSSSTYLYSGDGINPNNQGYALIAQLGTSVLKNRPTTPQSLGYLPESLILDADDLVNAVVLEGSNRRTLVNAAGSIVANWNNTDFQLPYCSTAGLIINDTSGNLTSSNAPTVSGLNLTALPTSTGLYPTLNQSTTGNAATATTATTATNFSGSLSGDVTGNQGTTVVVALNGTNLAGLATGILKNTHTTGVPTIAVSGTDYAPATSGGSILYGNGSGGFSNVSIGTGLSFSGGALSTTGAATVTSFSAGNLSPLFTSSVATSTTTPALTFALSSAAQNSVFAGPASGGAGAPSFQTAPTISGLNLTALPTSTGLYPTLNQNTTGTAAGLSATLAVASGGTGTTTPALVAGTNITISGTWPNQTINSSGGSVSGTPYSLIGNNTSGTTSASSLSTNVILGAPQFSDIGVGIQQTNSVAGYFQYLLQNTSSGTTSSTDITLNNNSGTASTYYVNLGINSSGFAGSGSLNLTNGSYLTSTTGDLAIGTTTNNAIHFVINGSTTDTLTINTSSQLVVPAFSTAGLVQNNASGILSSSVALPSTTTATTQSNGDNTTKVATDAFVLASTYQSGTNLGSLSSGLLYNTTSTGVPSIATANQVAAGLTGTTGTLNLSSSTLTIPAVVLPSATTATTQSNGDNSTKVATTAYVANNSASPGVFEATLTISAAGTNTITATGVTNSQVVVVNPGSGAYTTNLVLANTAGVQTNALWDITISMPASANPTLKIYSGSTSGTLLNTITSPNNIAGNLHLLYYYSSTTWVQIVDPLTQVDNSTITVNGSGIASVATATSSQLGVVKPDGTIITNTAGAITVATGTNAAKGVLQVDGTTITASSGTISATGLGSVGPIVFRNRIINGDMRINQRGVPASGTTYGIATGTGTSAGTYTVDRWYAFATTVACSAQQVTAPGGAYQYGLQLTGATSNAGLEWGQKIEATNIYDLASTTVILSVWMKASANITVTWSAYTPGSTDTWSGSRNLIASQTGTFSVTTTWTQFTTQIALNSTANTGLEIAFSVAALGNAATITISGVQLEAGSVATPFERLPISAETSLCQRYYYQIGTLGYSMWNTNTSNYVGNIIFPTQMRIAPAYALVGSWAFANASSITTTTSTTSVIVNMVQTGSVGASASLNTSSFVTFSAEL